MFIFVCMNSRIFRWHCKTPSEIAWMPMQLFTYEILKLPFTHCTDSLSGLPGIYEDHCSNSETSFWNAFCLFSMYTFISRHFLDWIAHTACIPLASSCRTYTSNKIATDSYIYKIQTCGIVFAAGQWHMIVQEVRVLKCFCLGHTNQALSRDVRWPLEQRAASEIMLSVTPY